jgi:tetratricopeptide (TPR) repeat protein
LVPGGRLARLAHLLSLFSRSDEASETLLSEKFFELQIQGDLSDYELRAIDRLRDIMALRSLTFAKPATGKNRIRQGFVTRSAMEFGDSEQAETFKFDTQDITESATVVAKLYWKLYETCLGTIPELRVVGLQLYFHLFGVAFQAETAKVRITRLTDAIQHDQGIPFLVLNLMRQGALHEARMVGRHLLTEGIELQDEHHANALYWLTEIVWFQQAWSSEKLTHETTLRFLYHLCFVSPERAGFLEIDSQFFSEFEMVSELAHEALTYRETLMESWIQLWEIYEGDFDPLFQKVLETVAGRSSKIYDHRASWEKLWKRSRQSFSRDYLFVVEGNLCYAAGHYQDAADFFEAALALTPDLRPALLNLAFVYAQLGKRESIDALAEKILADRRFTAASLYVLGDAYLLLGDEGSADVYYEKLRRQPGWENKVDHYKSTFCFQNGLHAQARRFAEAAYAATPNDLGVAYHYSLCLNANGSKDAALEILRAIEPMPQASWFHFYRFTLERDLGNHGDASRTLLQIPSEYFDDPEEREAALSFARTRQDIGLMRHLKNKNRPGE